MIPRLKPTLGWSELAAVLAPTGCDEVRRFEEGFARLVGQKHALAFPYGRTGLLLLLEALGLREREILCPAYTCVVVPHAIVKSGNEPVFVDSEDADFNMNLDLASQAITDRTGALIATSIFGYPVDLGHLDAIRARHPNLRVIQDCAHSFAAEWKGRPVQRAGDAALFGLNISKTITAIFGGMVTTDDDGLAERLRRLREERLRPPPWPKALRRRLYLAAVYPAFTGPIYGLVNRLERSGLLDRFVRYYDEARIDFPADALVAMTAIEGKIGRLQLRRYQGIVARRRRLAAFYDQALRGLPGLRLPPLVEGATYSHYAPRVARRDEVLRRALARGIQLGSLIEYSIPEMPAYRGRAGSRFPCPVAAALSRTTINLPLTVRDERGAGRVVRILKGALDWGNG